MIFIYVLAFSCQIELFTIAENISTERNSIKRRKGKEKKHWIFEPLTTQKNHTMFILGLWPKKKRSSE